MAVFKNRCTHIYLNPTIRMRLESQDGMRNFNAQRILIGKTLIQYKTYKAARAIAALLYFTAVSIEDAISKVGIRMSGFFNQKNLIGPNAKLAVG